MAKQTVNLGTSANKGDGDPLRTAFDKINDNFNELYAGNFTDPESIGTALKPDTDATYDLGASDKQWADLYVKDFIYLNGARIEVTAGGSLLVNGGAPAEVQDTVGSVFGDDSTLLVDGVNGVITGDVENGRVITGIVTSETDQDLYVYAGGTGAVILAGQSDASIGHTSGQVDIYGDVEFNNGTTAFQAGNSVTFNCDVTGAGFTYNQPALLGDSTQFGFDADTIDFGTSNTIDMQNCSLLLNGTTFTDEPWISLADLKALVAASTDFTDFQARIAAL